jgi:hypothetical protein
MHKIGAVSPDLAIWGAPPAGFLHAARRFPTLRIVFRKLRTSFQLDFVLSAPMPARHPASDQLMPDLGHRAENVGTSC